MPSADSAYRRSAEGLMNSSEEAAGRVVSLWRYPVKSMLGEELNASDLTERGFLGDRSYALLDPSTGMVVSAKNPRKWARMFEFRAEYVETPRTGQSLPPVRITCPDSAIATSDGDDVDSLLSKHLDRSVHLMISAPEASRYEEYWPDIEGLAHREKLKNVWDGIASSVTFSRWASPSMSGQYSSYLGASGAEIIKWTDRSRCL